MQMLLTAKHLLADPLNRVGKAYGRRMMEREGLLPLLAGRPRGAFPAEHDDLWFLYREAMERKPPVIWEFGSGYSTSVLAEAAYQYGGKVYSIDAVREWADVTRSCLLPRHVSTSVLYVPAIPDGTLGWRHESLPAEVPNFIYLDGPPLTRDRPIAVDVLAIEPALPAGCFLVVDGRKTNTFYLRDHLKRDWSFSWNRVAQRGAMELCG